MALIICSECEGKLSDKAPACPHCGNPIGEKDGKESEKVKNEAETSVKKAEEPKPQPASESKPEIAKEAKEKKPANKKLIIIIAGIVVFLIVGALLAFFLTANLRAYNDATELFEQGDFQASLVAFQELGDYRDSPEMVNWSNYHIAMGLYDQGILEDARVIFVSLGVFEDSQNMINTIDYDLATRLYNEGRLEEALNAFTQLGDYRDSRDLVNTINYEIGINHFINERFEEALAIFLNLGSYRDSQEMVEQTNFELSVDGQFLRAFSRGIMARWDQMAADEAAGLFGEDPVRLNALINIELEQIEGFYDQNFDNPALSQIATEYIDLLHEAADATRFHAIDYSQFITRWQQVFESRIIIIADLVNDFGITVDSEHQDQLDAMLIDAGAVKEIVEFRREVNDMVDGFEFISEADEWGWVSFTMRATNTTSRTFDHFWLSINVLDQNGNIIGSGNISSIENWRPGQEATVDAWFDDRDIDLDEVILEFSPSFRAGTISQ